MRVCCIWVSCTYNFIKSHEQASDFNREGLTGAVPPAIIATGIAILASMANLGVAFASSWYGFVQNLFGIQSMRVVMYVSVGGIILVGAVHLLLQRSLNKAFEANGANS